MIPDKMTGYFLRSPHQLQLQVSHTNKTTHVMLCYGYVSAYIKCYIYIERTVA